MDGRRGAVSTQFQREPRRLTPHSRPSGRRARGVAKSDSSLAQSAHQVIRSDLEHDTSGECARASPTIRSNSLESAARGARNWSYFLLGRRGHAAKRGARLAIGVVTEVPRQQVARRVAQLDVCLRSRPMCFHACESGPGLAGYCISDLIEPLFRRVARRNRPISGSATYRNTPREVFG